MRLRRPTPLSPTTCRSPARWARWRPTSARSTQIPVLSVEDEQRLAVRLREHNDIAAAQELILSHLRFVVHVARGYSGYGLQLGDLIQEGNIGLMKAVKRFDPTVGVRLVSFAVHWIRAEMHEFIIKNWRIVKVATTKAQRKLFFNLRKSKTRLGWLNAEEVRVARDLNVSEHEVLEMEARLSGSRHRLRCAGRRRRRPCPPAPVNYLVANNDIDPAMAYESANDEDTSSTCCAKAWPAWMRGRATSSSAAGWTRQQGHAAGAGRRIRRVRRTHPPGRGQRAEEDEGAVRGVSAVKTIEIETARSDPGRFVSLRSGFVRGPRHRQAPTTPDRHEAQAETQQRADHHRRRLRPVEAHARWPRCRRQPAPRPRRSRWVAAPPACAPPAGRGDAAADAADDAEGRRERRQAERQRLAGAEHRDSARPAASNISTGVAQASMVPCQRNVTRPASIAAQVAPVGQRRGRDRADQHIAHDAAGDRRHAGQHQHAEQVQPMAHRQHAAAQCEHKVMPSRSKASSSSDIVFMPRAAGRVIVAEDDPGRTLVAPVAHHQFRAPRRGCGSRSGRTRGPARTTRPAGRKPQLAEIDHRAIRPIVARLP